MSSSSLSLLQYIRITTTALREDTRTDAELLTRFTKARDEIAYASLVMRHGQMVWSVCRQILSDTHDVEDAFQVAFMSLSHRASKIHIETLPGWLYQVARQAALDIQKSSRARSTLRAQLQAMVRSEIYPQETDKYQTYAILHEEIAGLTEKLRVPLVLHFLEGKTQIEVSRVLGVSERAVRKRLERGKSILQKRLTQLGICVGAMPLATLLEGITAKAAISLDLVRRTVGASLAFRAGTLNNATTDVARQVLRSLSFGTGWMVKAGLVMLVCASGLRFGAFVWQAATMRHTDTDGLINAVVKEPPQREEKDEINQARLDAYGDPLPPGAMARLGSVRFCPGNGTSLLAFTPDGKGLITARDDHPISLWDRNTGKLLREFSDFPMYGDIILSPDRSIVAGRPRKRRPYEELFVTDWFRKFAGYKFNLWETNTGKLLRQFEKVRWPYAISPNNKVLAAATDLEPGEFGLWDIASGRQLWVTQQTDPSLLAFSANSKIVASSSKSKICLWDARKGRLLHAFDILKQVSCITFSPDSSKLVVEVSGESVRRSILLDVNTGKIWSLGEPQNSLHHAIFSPNGRIVAAVGAKPEASIYLWDISTRKQLKIFKNSNRSYGPLTFSPDGTTLLARGKTGIHLWDVATGKKLCRCQNSRWATGPRAFSPNGKTVAAVNGPIIRYWEAASGTVLPQPPASELTVGSMAFTPDGRVLVSRGGDGIVRLWDAWSGQERDKFPKEGLAFPQDFYPPGIGDYHKGFRADQMLSDVALSPDGKIVAGMGLDSSVPNKRSRRIYLWDIATGREFQKLEKRKDDGRLGVPVFSPNGKFLAAASLGDSEWDYKVFLWDVATGKRFQHQYPGWNPVFSPDGKILATQYRLWDKDHKLHDAALCLWDIATGKQLCCNAEEFRLFGLAFSPNERAFVTTNAFIPTMWLEEGKDNNEWTNREKKLKLYPLYRDKQSGVRIGSARTLITSDIPYNIRAFTFSPDGKTLAIAKEKDSTVYLWEISTGKERFRFQGHGETLRSLAFSSDGRRLAAGYENATILIWDVTGRMDGKGQLRVTRLSAKQMEERWRDLEFVDDVRAYQAMWTLVAAGQSTVAFLSNRLQPVPRVSVKTMDQLIAAMDSETFDVRQKARRRLEELREAAEPSIRQALKDKLSLHLRRSLDHLLSKIVEVQRGNPPGEIIRIFRAIEVLEHIGTNEARQVLEVLSSGAMGASQTREAKDSVARLKLRTASH